MTCDSSQEYCCDDCLLDMDSIVLLSILIPVGILLSVLLPCVIRYCVRRVQTKRLKKAADQRHEELKRKLSGYIVVKGLPFDSVWVAPDRHGNPQPHFKLPRLPKNWQKAVVPPRSPEVQAQLDAMNEAYAKSMSKRSKSAHGDKKSFTAQAHSSTIPRNCLHECTICKNAALTKTTPTFSNPNHAGYDQPDYKPSTMPTLDLCKGNEPNPVQPESNIITLPPPYEEVSPVSDCE